MLVIVNAIPAAMKPSAPAPDASAPALPDALNARMLQRLLSALGEIRAAALQLEATHAAAIEAIEPAHRASARNLLHYLGVRRHDIRLGPGFDQLGEQLRSGAVVADPVHARAHDAVPLGAGAARGDQRQHLVRHPTGVERGERGLLQAGGPGVAERAPQLHGERAGVAEEVRWRSRFERAHDGGARGWAKR